MADTAAPPAAAVAAAASPLAITESLLPFLSNKEALKPIVKHLHNNIQTREAIQLSKRIEYFRGKKLTSVLLDANKQNTLISKHCLTETDALAIGAALLRHQYILASKVRNAAKRELEPVRANIFRDDGYYTWLYQGSSFKRNFLLGLVIFGFLSAVMFPIWPQPLKVGVWYLSVTFLLLLTVLIIVRLVLYLIIWMFGYEFWLFPNLFDDDASVIESFTPVVTFEKGEQSKEAWISRAVGIASCAVAIVWLLNQPTEFDEMMVIQRQFIEDLYEGKLLSDEETKQPGQLDRIIPDLEELRRELEEEEDEETESVDDDDDDSHLDAYVHDDDEDE